VEKAKGSISRRRLILGGLGLAGAGLAAGLIDNRLRLSRHTLRLPHWQADGFRIAHLSDVHVNDGAKLRVAQEAVRMALNAKPDAIVFTGDFVNYARDDCLANITQAFAELADAQCPCLAVFGNHDYSCGEPAKVAEAVRRTPLRLLMNETVKAQGVRIVGLVGLDDALHGQPDHELTKKTVPSTVILLHEPDAVIDLKPKGSLVLSGHSHGGEVCLPNGTPLTTPPGSKVYRSGFYPGATAPLFVSRGVVTLGPGRVYCPPEVCILEIRAL
jgi:predicted MPP superfamily phosphohydrolase